MAQNWKLDPRRQIDVGSTKHAAPYEDTTQEILDWHKKKPLLDPGLLFLFSSINRRLPFGTPLGKSCTHVMTIRRRQTKQPAIVKGGRPRSTLQNDGRIESWPVQGGEWHIYADLKFRVFFWTQPRDLAREYGRTFSRLLSNLCILDLSLTPWLDL